MPKYDMLVWENESNPSVLRHPHAPHYCSLMNPLFPLNITSLWSEPFSIAPPPLISHWFMWFDSQLIVTIYANILCLFLRWGMKDYPSEYLVLITVFYCPHLNPSPFAMLLAVLSHLVDFLYWNVYIRPRAPCSLLLSLYNKNRYLDWYFIDKERAIS